MLLIPTVLCFTTACCGIVVTLLAAEPPRSLPVFALGIGVFGCGMTAAMICLAAWLSPS